MHSDGGFALCGGTAVRARVRATTDGDRAPPLRVSVAAVCGRQRGVYAEPSPTMTTPRQMTPAAIQRSRETYSLKIIRERRITST